MKRSTGGIRLILVTISVACVTAGTARAAAPARSVESFVKQKSRWESYARAKTILKVEGRYASVSRPLLRFRKCDLTFVAEPGEQFPNLTGRSLTIEVTGDSNQQHEFALTTK